MRKLFKLDKNYFTNGLVSRLFFQTLIILMIGGVLIRNDMIDTYEKFTQKQASQEFNLLAEKIYLVNEQSLEEMLVNNRVISPVVLRIAQAKAIRRLDELFHEHKLLGVVLDNDQIIYRNYPPKHGTIIHNGKIINDAKAFFKNSLVANQLQTTQVNETEYFTYKTDFTPWQWEITFAKKSNSYEYKGIVLEKSINIILLVGLLILSLAIISYFSIFLPIIKIYHSIRELHPPNYKGIVEFEFLSQHMNKTMQQLFSSIQAAEKAEQVKANFLANMSHEIRTPLNAITGLSHLALQGQLAPHTKDYLNKIDKASRSLLHIVNDILDYSKIEADKLVIDKHAFSLDELLIGIIDLNVFDANYKNIEIIIIGQQNLPDKLYGDSLRIAQVLLNLLNNAIKFTKNGQIIILLEQQENQDKTLSIKFTLQDTGIGISKEQLDNLFQPFSQADSSTTRQYGGTGLGLTICQRLITLMDGQLHVTSELEQGSRFCFEIPLSVDSEWGYSTNIMAANDDLQKKRLLLIETNSTAREAINDIAESLNLAVTTENTLKGALDIITDSALNHPYEFILIDDKLGEDNIFQFTREITRSNEEKSPHLILMTSSLIISTEIQSDLNTAIQKPIMPKSLFSKLQALTQDKIAPQIEQDPKISNTLSGLQILVAEDNVINQQVICELLTKEGAQTTLVDNGLKAIEMVNLKNGAFDLILMDIQMPVLDGYQASQEIRKLYDKQGLPIIALSANTSQEDKDRAKQFGINNYISKPLDPQKLFDIICDYCPDKLLSDLAFNKTKIANPISKLELEAIFPASLLTEASAINMTMAIKNVGGNALFLKSLLIQFYQNHKGDIEKIDQALARNDILSIQRIAHTLKGIAATLGANRLFHSSKSIKKMHQKNSDQYQSMIDRLKSDLSMLLSQFLPLFDGHAMVKELTIANVKDTTNKIDANNSNRQTLAIAVNALKNALAKGAYVPKSQLEALQIILQQTNRNIDIQPLIALVDNFEFDKAQSELLKITKELGINVEE